MREMAKICFFLKLTCDSQKKYLQDQHTNNIENNIQIENIQVNMVMFL